jgi:integrase
MATNINISLDKRRKKQDGTFPVVFRIGHFRRTVVIQTGFAVPEKAWDAKRREIKKSFTDLGSTARINNKLLKQKAEMLQKVEELAQSNQLNSLSATELKELLTQKADSSSIFVFTEKLIEDLRKAQKFGNARNYRIVMGVLKTYCQEIGKEDLLFREINYRFLKNFEHSHLAKGNSINSLSVYLRAVRALYNKAIKEGIAKLEEYPFKAYQIKSKPTQKRAITLEDLQKILTLNLEKGTKLFQYRNYFITSYLLWGISFMDMAFLKLENIASDRMKYRRRKTEKLYDIRISGQLSEILAYYTDGKEAQDFIFPIIKRTELEDQLRDIKWARKRYNKGLREIQKMCGIEEKLTSYVARHSFATQALLNEIPIKAISEMLGHSDLSTTQVYLKSLPTNVLDDYADRLRLE